MWMGRKIRVLLLLALCGALSGCGQDAPDPSETRDRFHVRMLTSLPLSGRWERSAERGLGQVAAELGATVGRERVLESSDLRSVVIDQGRRGVRLVFCVGPGFESIVFAEAHSYPETVYVLLPGRAHRDNVASIEFVSEGAAYVAGVVSASLSSSTRVGVIRGVGGEWLDEIERGFVAGFRSTGWNRRVTAVGSPNGPWELASDGIDVALYATDRPEREVLAAAHDAGLLLVSVGDDVMEAEPDVVAAAIEVDVAEAMTRIAREVRDGGFDGGVYGFGLGSGVLGVRLNPTLPEAGLPAVRAALEKAKSEVTAGIIELEGLGM